MLDLKNYKYQSDFARKYYGQGHEKGRQEGRRKGRQEGREEGLRSAIMALVGARLPALRDERQARLGGRSEAQLLRIATELGKAKGKAGIRAALGDRPRAKRRAHSRREPAGSR